MRLRASLQNLRERLLLATLPQHCRSSLRCSLPTALASRSALPFAREASRRRLLLGGTADLPLSEHREHRLDARVEPQPLLGTAPASPRTPPRHRGTAPEPPGRCGATCRAATRDASHVPPRRRREPSLHAEEELRRRRQAHDLRPPRCVRPKPPNAPRARETTPRAPSIVASPNAPPAAARFSPDDKFSSQRIACKKRFGLLLTQQPPDKM